jgi:hypothetical protein
MEFFPEAPLRTKSGWNRETEVLQPDALPYCRSFSSEGVNKSASNLNARQCDIKQWIDGNMILS